jgi:signal transduction histidine kinase
MRKNQADVRRHIPILKRGRLTPENLAFKIPKIGDGGLTKFRCTLKVVFSRQVTHKSIGRVLLVGFGSVIVLLAVAGWMGVQNVRSIRQSAAGLLAEQRVTDHIIGGLLREQRTLNAVFYDMARDPDAVDAANILEQLDDSDRAIAALAKNARGTADENRWAELEAATSAFSTEVRRILSFEEPESFWSLDLLRRHTDVVAITSRLLAAGSRRASSAQTQIEDRCAELLRYSALLFGSSLLLATGFALWTVRMTAELFRRMEWQTGELSRVSWHMVENQETTARRFSHELHDELGQSLTAVKANLSAITAADENGRARLSETRRLVDEAVSNVRELSQLLRPVILDDLGLDAALRSLTEGFMHRTGIRVEYRSNFDGRLQDETETHLFRIAQEALTNIARHSRAANVEIDLHAESERIMLSIRDDGKGLEEASETGTGLGMIGMRARASNMGGELHVESPKTGGVSLQVSVPMKAEREANDPHLVS